MHRLSTIPVGLLLLLFSPSSIHAQTILGFKIYDTETSLPIRYLSPNDVVDLKDFPPSTQLTVVVDVWDIMNNIEYVRMDIDNGSTIRTDAFPPYALGGDILHHPVALFSELGTHTLTATIHPKRTVHPLDALQLVLKKTVEFRIVNSAATTESPTEPPSPPPLTSTDVTAVPCSMKGTLSGELRQWHKITLGVLLDETMNEEDAKNVRFDVTFGHFPSGKTYTVPGYFAADGNAANTHATTGSCWLVHFAPDRVGTWTYAVSSFVEGPLAAASGQGTRRRGVHGMTGTFFVQATDKNGADFRSKGRLDYVGQHHLQFSGTNEWYWQVGADSPENLLAYTDFDNTPNYGGYRKTWGPHVRDYRPEPRTTWSGGKGKGLIGALNYLASKGMNAVSFLTLNIGGDDKNVFPYVSNKKQDRLHFDTSKLAQWEAVFEHADRIGLQLHVKLQEVELDRLLDSGKLGVERKLYYREMIARFSHHLGITWNIGEENANTDRQRKIFADYIKRLDPYDHPLVVHTHPNEKDAVYSKLLRHRSYDGASLQSHYKNVARDTEKWVRLSRNAGRKWVVVNDEQNPHTHGVLPDRVTDHRRTRQHVLWGNLMAGGAGVAYYFGYSYEQSDLTCQDFRSRSDMWDQTRYALEFLQFNEVPFWKMESANYLVSTGWALATGDANTVVVYLPKAESVKLSFPSHDRIRFDVRWFNPRTGMIAHKTLRTTGRRGYMIFHGPPYDEGDDWVILLKRRVDEFKGVLECPIYDPDCWPSSDDDAAKEAVSTPTNSPSAIHEYKADDVNPTDSPTVAIEFQADDLVPKELPVTIPSPSTYAPIYLPAPFVAPTKVPSEDPSFQSVRPPFLNQESLLPTEAPSGSTLKPSEIRYSGGSSPWAPKHSPAPATPWPIWTTPPTWGVMVEPPYTLEPTKMGSSEESSPWAPKHSPVPTSPPTRQKQPSSASRSDTPPIMQQSQDPSKSASLWPTHPPLQKFSAAPSALVQTSVPSSIPTTVVPTVQKQQENSLSLPLYLNLGSSEDWMDEYNDLGGHLWRRDEGNSSEPPYHNPKANWPLCRYQRTGSPLKLDLHPFPNDLIVTVRLYFCKDDENFLAAADSKIWIQGMPVMMGAEASSNSMLMTEYQVEDIVVVENHVSIVLEHDGGMPPLLAAVAILDATWL